MKKILFLILAIFLVLAACGNEEESKLDDTKETKSEDKESKKDDKDSDKGSDEEKDKSDEKQKSDDKSSEEVAEQDDSTEEPQSQEQVNTQEQQSTQEQQRTEIDLNRSPGTDFSTEGMSEDAQMQIEELTRQKDFEGLPQNEYNNRVSEIMNNDMN